jgi:CubicO group peptidase (beta-lactamase class C family)
MRRPTFLLTSTALLILSTFSAAAAPADTPEATKLHGVSERMKEFVDKNEIAGAVTLVVSRDRVLHLDATGKADLAQGTPMQADSICWIASMTKPVTGAAILILQEEGKLSVDDPVGKYVPELGHLKTSDGKEHRVTLRHLLTHTSGMGEATPPESRNAKTLADLVPAFASKPLSFEPGSRWAYCQSGINTLGRIVEVVSGKPLPEFFQERIFGPLGMKDTTFYLSPEQLPRLAKSYRLTNGKLEEAKVSVLQGREPTTRDRAPLANGGLFSTAPDYGRFCQMLLNKGTLDGKRVMKPESVEQMATVQSGDVVTGFTPGNGWGSAACVVRQPQGVTAMLSPGTFGHGGAYGTQAWIDPKKGVAYVLMVQRANFPNSDDSPVRKVFQQAAADALAGSRAEGR